MKQGWEIKTLGEVAPSKPYTGAVPSVKGKYWLLNLDMIEPNTGNVIEKVYFSQADMGNSITKFNSENVLYSKLRPYLNKVVVPCVEGFATTELITLCPAKNILNRYFLSYFLRNPSFVTAINGKVIGAKMPRVSMKDFWTFPIPVPPLSEQEHIVSELDLLSGVIEKKKQQLKELDNLAQAIFFDMFGDPIANDKGWKVSTFDKEFEYIKAGGDKPDEYAKNKSELYPIPIYSNGVDNDGLFGYCKGAKIEKPCITISGRGTIGYCSIKREPFTPIIRLIVAIPRSSINLEYSRQFVSLIKFPRTGNTIPQLPVPIVKAQKILVPPLPLQQQFASKVSAIESQKAKIKQSLAEAETLFQSRMSYYFD